MQKNILLGILILCVAAGLSSRADALPPLFLTNTAITQYQYDDTGNLRFQIDALHRTNSYTYDVAGRLITHTLALGQTATNQFDAQGNLTNHTDFNGFRTTFLYDDQN